MRRYHALQICEQYREVPQTRADQEKLIRMMYSTLRGRALSQCSEHQIYQTAKRLYDQARAQVNVFSADVDLIERAAENNALRLGQIFAVPEDEVDSEVLEARLLE